MPLRTIFFDLDDTLLETYPAHQAAVRACCERVHALHADWPPERLCEVFLQTYRKLEAMVEAGTLKFANIGLFRTRVWSDTLSSIGLPPDLGEELGRTYQEERRRRYRLYDDVPAVLDRLASRYRLVLVTNGPGDLQREKTTAVGIERWFPHLVISGEVESWKPDAGIFRRALELAGAGPEESMMVGDSLERDIAGAAALGIPTVWMRRYEHLRLLPGIIPDHTVADLEAVEALVTGSA